MSFLDSWAARRFHRRLIEKTGNFKDGTWLGTPILQNVLDLWTLQEAIAAIRPALLIETGTNQGGAAQFYANLFDLLGHGEVVTIDVGVVHQLDHPRVTAITGDSASEEVLAQVRAATVRTGGPVMVVLDSDHSQAHVDRELDAYQGFVTPGSLMLVQDSVIDTHPMFRGGRPGPLPAIERFLGVHPEFSVDADLDERFIISHHPRGWLRRDG